jgi:hypothetical protein
MNIYLFVSTLYRRTPLIKEYKKHAVLYMLDTNNMNSRGQIADMYISQNF